ncbi:MAG TPA: hypothetical protein VHQ20_01140 [Patescibacteria group bacterium]|jgi:hypothetical protein|nr:hypothetical protein [Patescibacteria group bacterium]
MVDFGNGYSGKDDSFRARTMMPDYKDGTTSGDYPTDPKQLAETSKELGRILAWTGAGVIAITLIVAGIYWVANYFFSTPR